VTEGTNRWVEEVRTRAEAQKKAKAVWDKFQPAVDLALDEFLQTAQWPQRERFRRTLTQRGLGDLSLEEMLHRMPRSSWDANTAVPDQIILSLQVLEELPKAKKLLDVAMAMVRRAYELYSSDTDDADDLKLRSDDPVLLSAAGGDAGLLLRALKILDQHSPHPLGGGGSNPDSGTWSRWLHQAVMPAFKDVATVKDYLTAQAKIIDNDRKIYGPVAELLGRSFFGTAASQAAQTTAPAATATTADFFVIMPFGQAWSDGTYAFIRRAIYKLENPEQVHLYRADQIATPGQISEQIKDAIIHARVVIADITGVNPNVMKDRRQVSYHASPTDDDETNLVRHLEAALRAAGLTGAALS
jgi:hypothetical protein